MTDIDAPMRYASPAADRTERDGSVALVYSEHFFEHIGYPDDAMHLLVPNAGREYEANDTERIGAYTQLIGMTEALRWLPVPGRWEGCVPLQPGQPAWA